MPRGWALLAALVVCIGQTVADAHMHVDEHEEEVCTVCAISESGRDPEAEWIVVRPSEPRRLDSLPVFSATRFARPYELGRPRAPPVS